MSCIKNPKKWLWFKYEGDHDYRAIRVWKFMDCSSEFCAELKCILCGAKTIRYFIEWDELQRIGIPNEQIEKIGTIRPFSDESLYVNYLSGSDPNQQTK